MTLTHVAVAALAGLVLVGTLMLYLQPGFMVNLADQIWSCF